MANLQSPLRIGTNTGTGSSGYAQQFQIWTFNEFYADNYVNHYLHIKTDLVPTDKIVRFEALGYHYGQAKFIRNDWAVYAYNNAVYDRTRGNYAGGALDAYAPYKSSDGYTVLKMFGSSWYFAAFILNVYTWGMASTYGTNVNVLSYVINTNSGSHY
jgi:hypothetical protein